MSDKKNKLTFLGRASFLILILPYLVIISPELLLSPLSSMFNVTLLFFCLAFISIVYSKLFNPIPKRFFLFIFCNSLILTVFYYDTIFFRIYNSLNIIFIHHEIRFIFLVSIFFILSFSLQYSIRNHIKIAVKVVNVFFLIFLLNTLVFKFNQNKMFFLNPNPISSPLIIPTRIENIRQTILIIVDEYASPRDLYNNFKDSSVYEFSSLLKLNNWRVTDHNYSFDTMTINSLASIFNFNFSKTPKQFPNFDYYGQRLIQSTLYDSLINKGCHFYNFGIFDIGESKAPYRVYFYAKSFTDQVFNRSIFNPFNFSKDNENGDHFAHNKYLFDSVPKKLIDIKDNHYFVYMHLLIPHQPFSYGKEFQKNKAGKKRTIENYYAYWKFSNTKLSSLIAELTKDNRYNIILTGDHGFRHMKEVPPNYTFTAFYGFDSTQLTNLKSVQDIGSLINASY